MTSEVISQLMSALAAEHAPVRERAADEITDIHKRLSVSELEALIETLCNARLQESIPACQEAQLNAIAELVAWHNITSPRVSALRALKRHNLDPSQQEYLAFLLGESR